MVKSNQTLFFLYPIMVHIGVWVRVRQILGVDDVFFGNQRMPQMPTKIGDIACGSRVGGDDVNDLTRLGLAYRAM